jgi:hypothetical protein
VTSSEHGPRRGDRLQPRRSVDRIAEHHPLDLGGDLDRCAAGQHAGADSQARQADLLGQRAARTARSASSSRGTGVPHTAITASPMVLSAGIKSGADDLRRAPRNAATPLLHLPAAATPSIPADCRRKSTGGTGLRVGRSAWLTSRRGTILPKGRGATSF